MKANLDRRCSLGLGKILVKKPRIQSFLKLSVFWVKSGPKTKDNPLKVSMGIQVLITTSRCELHCIKVSW